MQYQKINLELIVDSQETDAVVAELNSALDRMDEMYAIFGGNIETMAIEQSGTPRKKSALRHTLEAGKAAASAIELASQKVAQAYKKVI